MALPRLAHRTACAAALADRPQSRRARHTGDRRRRPNADDTRRRGAQNRQRLERT